MSNAHDAAPTIRTLTPRTRPPAPVPGGVSDLAGLDLATNGFDEDVDHVGGRVREVRPIPFDHGICCPRIRISWSMIRWASRLTTGPTSRFHTPYLNVRSV